MTTRSLVRIGSLLIASSLTMPFLASAADKAAAKAPSVTVTQASKSVAAKTPVVSLIATGKDADGKIVSYHWKQVSGPSVALADVHTDWASFTAPTTSKDVNLVFEVTVTDNDKLSATAVATVTVTPEKTHSLAANQ